MSGVAVTLRKLSRIKFFPSTSPQPAQDLHEGAAALRLPVAAGANVRQVEVEPSVTGIAAVVATALLAALAAIEAWPDEA
jgi:hypothetical protein